VKQDLGTSGWQLICDYTGCRSIWKSARRVPTKVDQAEIPPAGRAARMRSKAAMSDQERFEAGVVVRAAGDMAKPGNRARDIIGYP
jgi:hypothetical protein